MTRAAISVSAEGHPLIKRAARAVHRLYHAEFVQLKQFYFCSKNDYGPVNHTSRVVPICYA